MFGDARQGIISFDRCGVYPIGYILYTFMIFIPDVIQYLLQRCGYHVDAA